MRWALTMVSSTRTRAWRPGDAFVSIILTIALAVPTGQQVLYLNPSYTSYNYTNLKFRPNTWSATVSHSHSMDVQNAGRRAGDEVVQLYVHDLAAGLKRPSKELRGFERISLKREKRRPSPFLCLTGNWLSTM